MGKKKETYTFLGKVYSLDRAMGVCADGGPGVPIWIDNNADRAGRFRAVTTIWFDNNVARPVDDCAYGETPRAAVRSLDRQIVRGFKRLAKACGYTVTG